MPDENGLNTISEYSKESNIKNRNLLLFNHADYSFIDQSPFFNYINIMNIMEEIAYLKKSKDVVILAHNYQLPEVQDIADIVGDSLELSRKAATLSSKIILFAGVKFMAETAKILSPLKTVLLPEMDAGCPLADMITEEQLLKLKTEYPEAGVVSYVNSNIGIKALSDCCCTSANAARVVAAMPQDEIIFIPDRNLGAWVQKSTTKKLICNEGYCIVHEVVRPDHLVALKAGHPDAKVIAHPECPPSVLALADTVESTSGMLRYVENSSAEEFIVVTEQGMNHRLRKQFPDRTFYDMQPSMICKNMKKTTIHSILQALKREQYRIELDTGLMDRARKPLEKMISIL